MVYSLKLNLCYMALLQNHHVVIGTYKPFNNPTPC